ncbi:GNAT family N-acetyltransferase [Saccharopolyspora griseoalba]|uniref:GNAT family N-acetyltransferase n=1 Tax=Saccharopolyspora griseoalba TaxID=1431848 RepID=A0ABW2LIA0_9PSEU
MADLDARELTDAELDEFPAVFGAAFLQDTDDEIERWRPLVDHIRPIGVCDGSELIGVAGHYDEAIALPGGVVRPVAAVTTVGVKPGHRRRGAATALMRRQLDGLRAAGVPLAALHASEGAIYGRYGYGPASTSNHLEIPRGARFRPGAEIDEQPVRELPLERARAEFQRQHARIFPHRAGWLARDGDAWEARERMRRSAGNRPDRFALHPQGHVVYRGKPDWTGRGPNYELEIVALAAETPQAYAALWRYLLDFDLAAEVVWPKAAADEPIVHLLADPRAARQQHFDGLWLRLIDVAAALPARGYAAEADVVLEVSDDFCPWNAGRWRLRTAPEVAVSRTESPAQLTLDVADLAAAYLGGTTLTSLAAAGRVREHEAGALAAASRAFATDRPPNCPDAF